MEYDPSERLRALFSRLYVPAKLRACSENTLRLYEQAFCRFQDFLGHNPGLPDLTDETVSAFLAWRRHNGLSAETVERERDRLCALWRFLCQRRRQNGKPWILHWPTIEPERLPRRVPLAWMIPELSSLLDTCHKAESVAGCPVLIGGIAANLWWTALVRTMYVTGERIGAMLGLHWDCVDLSGRWVIFRAETRKGGLIERMYPLDKPACAALAKIRRQPGCAVFPWDRHYTDVWAVFGRLLRAAGLPDDSRSKFHRIRRTTASYYEQAGGDAQALLGHRDRATTERYLDPRICRTSGSAADLLPRIA